MTKPISPILIASKGRPQNSPTIRNLVADGLRPKLFLEKEDLEGYQSAYGDKVSYYGLGKSNQGIGYVRQQILAFAREKGYDSYWTLDDDITRMYEIIKNVSVKSTFDHCLSHAEASLKTIKNLAIGGLEYNQFAWAASKRFAFNGYCEVATFVNLENCRVNYRPEVNLKEDRDFVLQSLALGYVSARTSQYAFAAPKNGSNKGGLYDEYKSGIEAERVKKFCALWPGICEPITKKDGRCDAKINWRLFKNAPVF